MTALVVAWITLAVVLSSGYFFSHTGSGFMPVQDEGRFMISVKTPLGSSISYTEEKLKAIEKVLDRHEDIASYFVTIGADRSRQVSKGSFLVRMVPWDQRDIAQIDMIQQLRMELAGIAGTFTDAASRRCRYVVVVAGTVAVVVETIALLVRQGAKQRIAGVFE